MPLLEISTEDKIMQRNLSNFVTLSINQKGFYLEEWLIVILFLNKEALE